MQPISHKRTQSNAYEQAKTQNHDQEYSSSRRIFTEQVSQKNIKPNMTESNQFHKTQFPSISTAQSKTLSASMNLHTQVQNRIRDQITVGKIKISRNQTQYAVLSQRRKSLKQINPESSIKQKLIDMQRKKQQTLSLLKLLQEQQKEIKKKSVSFTLKRENYESQGLKKQKSFYSPEQRKQVGKMLKRKSMLQCELKQKTQNALNYYLRCTNEQKQRYRSQIQIQRSMHKSFAQQNRQSLELKKIERFKLIEDGNKKYQSVKSKKYLHQTKQEIDRLKAEEQGLEIKKRLDVIKNKMKITTVQEINQHRQRYKQIMKSKVQGRGSLLLHPFRSDADVYNSKILKKKIQQNYFTKLIKKQLDQKRIEDQKAKNRPIQLQKKIKNFAEQCDLQIRPKIKITQQSKFSPLERNQSVNSLSYFQQRSKGKQYLSVAKRLKKCETQQDQKIVQNNASERVNRKGSKSQYKNYLNEMRRLSDNNPQSARRKFSNYLQKQGTISQFNSLNKAVVVAEGYQAKSKKSNNEKLIDSVQNKINILKMIF